MNRAAWSVLGARLGVPVYWPTWCVLAYDCAVAALAWRLYRHGGWAVAAAIALLGHALLHLYLLLHEATHRAAGRSRAVNEFLGHLCGWLVAMPFLARRRSHLLHHRWTGHPEADPANRRMIARFAVMTPAQAAKLERVWRWWAPVLVLNDRAGLWRAAWADPPAGRAPARRERRAAVLYVLGYVLAGVLLARAGLLLWTVGLYLPSLLLAMLGEELVNLPHHAGTPLLDPGSAALPLWEQHRVTHSCRAVPLWSRLILLNFNLHTAHHLYPALPWHALPRAEREIAALLPDYAAHVTPAELPWALRHRRAPLLDLMGHYFDRLPEGEARRHALRAGDAGAGPA